MDNNKEPVKNNVSNYPNLDESNQKLASEQEEQSQIQQNSDQQQQQSNNQQQQNQYQNNQNQNYQNQNGVQIQSNNLYQPPVINQCPKKPGFFDKLVNDLKNGFKEVQRGINSEELVNCFYCFQPQIVQKHVLHCYICHNCSAQNGAVYQPQHPKPRVIFIRMQCYSCQKLIVFCPKNNEFQQCEHCQEWNKMDMNTQEQAKQQQIKYLETVPKQHEEYLQKKNVPQQQQYPQQQQFQQQQQQQHQQQQQQQQQQNQPQQHGSNQNCQNQQNLQQTGQENNQNQNEFDKEPQI